VSGVGRPLHALVVGLGSIGRRHARNWAALKLGPVSVCRQVGLAQPESLGVAAREFFDLDEALGARPDVVLVTNPTRLHVETALRAVRAGAHVLVEKPLGDALDGVAELLSEAQAAGRRIMVGYNLRFHPGLARVKELVDAGAVGHIVSVRASVGEYLPGWHPAEDYRRGYSARRDLGGGAVLTLSHELDAVCWLLGAPSQVMGMAIHATSLDVDTDDVAELTLKYPRCLASVHMDYARRPPARSLEIVGEEGVLRWEYDEARLLRSAPATGQWRVEEGDRRFDRNDMFLAELAHFASCIHGDRDRPLIDGTQGAAVLAIALAALRSSATGRAVDLQAEGEPVTTWLAALGSIGADG
jgi:predicted dehydrogenase